MTCTEPIVVTRGSCVDIDLIFLNEDGTVEDITDDTFEIFETMPPALAAQVSISKEMIEYEGLDGETHEDLGVRLHVEEEDADAILHLGRLNWIRVTQVYDGELSPADPDACTETTPQIWIEVR